MKDSHHFNSCHRSIHCQAPTSMVIYRLDTLYKKVITLFQSNPKTPIDTLLELNASTKGAISRIYDTISAINPQSLKNLRTIWEQDLGQSFAEDQWTSVLKLINCSSACARHNFNSR